jgi:hypothetical protein
MSLAAEHQADLAKLSELSEQALAEAWASGAAQGAAETRDLLMTVVPLVAEQYGDMAAAVGADFYDAARAAAGAAGSFVADLAPLPGSARYEALVRWGVDPLFHPEDHDLREQTPEELTRSLVSGGLQRVVSNADRLTVVENTRRDPAASGWQRVTRPGACRFCRMLHDRGAVYSKETVTFSSHDHCHCAASPSFDPGRQVSVIAYTASLKHQSDADKARVRAYLSEHYSDA